MKADTQFDKQDQLPSPESYESSVFPLNNHPLYGDVPSFGESQYLMPKVLADFTNDFDFEEHVTSLEICPACFFNTSGTTSRSKRIPYSDDDLDRQRIHEAIALTKLGMGKGDGVISLGAPLPSISGWAIVNGSETTGATVLNSSQIDYDDVFLRGHEAKATIVIGTPIVVKEIGLAIKEERGDLQKVFPNMRTGIIFGDVLPTALRKEIKEIWGFETVYSLYGTVEADVVATESREFPGEMELMTERLLIEVIPESELAKEREDESYAATPSELNSVDDGTVGEIVISDLSRSVLPLIRYRIGDIIEVRREGRPAGKETVKVLGRSKNIILLDGVPLYEMQLNSAIERALGGRVSEWRITEREGEDRGKYDLSIQPASGEHLGVGDREGVINAIREERIELERLILSDYIRVSTVETLGQDDVQGDAKAKRIVLQA